jgi:uncharacterized protein (TIGR02996 family)
LSDRDALYRAILERPADDAPRLVYADWLEEHGDLERAELIRHMVHFPRDAVEYRPPKTASVYWPDAPPWVRYTVRRGFVADITLSTRQFLEFAADLFVRHPIIKVRIMDLGALILGGKAVAVLRADPRDAMQWPHDLFPDHEDGAQLVFSSRKAAARALSRAAVTYGRSKAVLPSLS